MLNYGYMAGGYKACAWECVARPDANLLKGTSPLDRNQPFSIATLKKKKKGLAKNKKGLAFFVELARKQDSLEITS